MDKRNSVLRIGVPALILFAGIQANASDDGWLAYQNARWNFRIERPAGWAMDQGADGAGLLMTHDGQGVAVGAGYRLEEDNPAHPPPICKSATRIDPLIGRRRDAAIGEPRNVVSRVTRFRGQPACFERWTFTVRGAPYVGEYVTVPRGRLEYHLSLECRRSDCAVVRRVYRRVVASLRFARDP
jgi:hypothetical protein